MGVWDGKSKEDDSQEGRFKGRVKKKNENSKADVPQPLETVC